MVDHSHALKTLRLWALLLLLCTAGSYQFASAQTTSGGGFNFTPTGGSSASTGTTINITVPTGAQTSGGTGASTNGTGNVGGGGIGFTAGGFGSAAATTPASASSPLCVVLTTNLGPGYNDTSTTTNRGGGDVTRLQSFLAQTATIYPEGVVNGVYDAATQRAVQRWQKLHGVISYGSPSTTGYGAVGSRTRALMAQGCSGAPKLPTGIPAITAAATSPTAVAFVYTNMPDSAKFVFMSAASGARYDPPSAVTSYGESGSASMQLNTNMVWGVYVIRALSSQKETVLAQSNIFYAGKHINNYAAFIDPASLSENLPQPTISGTAVGVSSVGIAIYRDGAKVYGSGDLPVAGGRWSITVNPALSFGSYQVWVYSPESILLTTGTMNILR